MPPRDPAKIRIETTTVGTRQVVYLYVNGYRLEMEASSGAQARSFAFELALALGLGDDRG
jgi:hypothetical protein